MIGSTVRLGQKRKQFRFACSPISRRRAYVIHAEHGTFTSTSRLLSSDFKGVQMPLGTILLIILVVLLIGALPSWPYSAQWGP